VPGLRLKPRLDADTLSGIFPLIDKRPKLHCSKIYRVAFKSKNKGHNKVKVVGTGPHRPTGA